MSPEAVRRVSASTTNGAAVKVNIPDEEFARLHEHVEKLAEMMITETLPVPVRLVLEDVCDIVLGDPA